MCVCTCVFLYTPHLSAMTHVHTWTHTTSWSKGWREHAKDTGEGNEGGRRGWVILMVIVHKYHTYPPPTYTHTHKHAYARTRTQSCSYPIRGHYIDTLFPDICHWWNEPEICKNIASENALPIHETYWLDWPNRHPANHSHLGHGTCMCHSLFCTRTTVCSTHVCRSGPNG